MKFAALVTLALFAAVPAGATIIDTKFTGTVASQAGSAYTVGSPISGEFVYDTTSNAFVSFTVGGVAIPAGYSSSASVSPGGFSAIYRAQISPVAQGGTLNRTFTLDLEALSSFPSGLSAAALLTSPGVLPGALDLASNPASQFPSTFSSLFANADGTNTVRVLANLVSVNSTVVPEPASLALAGSFLLAAGALRRRR